MAEYNGQVIPGDDFYNPSPNTQATEITTENLLDKIADALILNTDLAVDKNFLQRNQKTIRDGIISVGRTNADTLLLFQKDIKANGQDLQNIDSNGRTFEGIIDTLKSSGHFLENVQVTIIPLGEGEIYDVGILLEVQTTDIGPFDVSELLSGVNQDGSRNPVNISQFLSIDTTATSINKLQAEEFLDTNIYELLPGSSIRQERIDNAISELRTLLPPDIPDSEWFDEFGRINRNQDTGEWIGSEQYYLDNSISAAQNGAPGASDEEDGFITRLEDKESGLNIGKSIQSLRNELSEYLKDIDEEGIPPEDNRIVYRNQSDGYLKFRNLNQGIIVRNTNQDFIEGLDPENPTYLQTGFTITMWVRFLDKVSEGTLFNFGNPLRDALPFGFTLDTFVLSPDSPTGLSGGASTFEGVNGYSSVVGPDNPNGALFTDTESERFVRLVVYDNNNDKTHDSHTANPHMVKQTFTPFVGADGITGSNILSMFNNTRIPQDFSEWYFICATFNPDIQEEASFEFSDLQTNHNFWMNHIEPFNNASVVNSTYGNKCKVEIISRSDLLRARGFKVD
tara:strand:+ start:1038 stop:2735 length:1698 start_codon:yes stop_codon:yes gene_type:complete